MTSPRDATTKVTAPTGAEFIPLGRTGESDSAAITLSQALEGPAIYVAASDSTADAKKYAGTTYTCDGTADDVEIQAAIDALPDGGTLVLLHGTYTINAVITTGARQITIRGEGLYRAGAEDGGTKQGTVILNNNDSHAIHFAPSNASQILVMEDLLIDDALGAGVRTAGAGLYAAGTASNNVIVHLRNIKIYSHDYGFQLVRPAHSVLENCRAQWCDQDGFRVDATGTSDGGTTTKFDTCFASSNGGDGYSLDGLAYSTLINCSSDSNARGYAILDTNRFCRGLAFVGCGSEGSTGDGCLIDGAWSVTFSAGRITSSGGDGIQIDNSDSVIINGTLFSTNTGYGINVASGGAQTSNGHVFINPRFHLNTAGTLNDVNGLAMMIYGHQIFTTASAGISIGASPPATPDGTLHVHTASAGTVNASGDADEAIFENSGNTGISILGGTSDDCYIMFGDSDNSAIGRIRYRNQANSMEFYVNNSLAFSVLSNGEIRGQIEHGTTAQRPSGVLARMYYDTTLGQPIWYNGTNWVDATGSIV